MLRRLRAWASGSVWCLAGIAGFAQAASIVGVTPQGEVAQVRQISVKFSEPVVPLGDPRLPDPMSLSCQGAVPPGSGRWANDRAWLYDFREPLPPGARCVLTPRPDWKPMNGALSAAASYAFNTGGPAVLSSRPYEGGQVDEDQRFVLQLNGAAVESTVLANAWCEVEGIGERIGVELVGGQPREELLKALHIEDKALVARTLVLACKRPLPNGAAMRLVWGKGIGAAGNPRVTTSMERRLRFTVRAALTADFSCERERANAPCLPIRPMTLRFSAPIPRELAAKVRLQPASGAGLAPVFAPDDKAATVGELKFPLPLPDNARFDIVLPADLRDDAGRPLANASMFPLKVATGEAPAIAKFAAAPFGIVESADPVLPLTLRHVQDDLRPAAAGGQVRVKSLRTDADILAWYAKLKRLDDSQISAKDFGLPEKDWYVFEDDTDARGRPIKRKAEHYLATREISLLNKDADAKRMDLPTLVGGDPRPFEVVGVPIAEPGYHVVEIESQRLGQALLDKRAPMYVRTGVLVTNLGVHVKLGRENSLVWVTSLDRGRPVEGADVTVNDCLGHALWQGKTDALGLAKVQRALDPERAECPADPGLFVTARKLDAKGVLDTSFVFSSWQKGIESWRFNLPMGRGPEPDVRAATVMDRSLFRAGETVSMKHFVRAETSTGLAELKPNQLPTQVKITHQGSGQSYTQPLRWNGARDAVSSWPIPPAAKLGAYSVSLERPDADPARAHEWSSGTFRVEEFRLPLVDARISGPKAAVIAPRDMPLAVQLNYFSGGPMAAVAARGSALLQSRAVAFDGYDDFSFEPPRDPKQAAGNSGDEDSEAVPETAGGKLVADKLPLLTDRNGAASFELKDLPPITRPSEIDAELTYNDPNGEVATVAASIPVWPSAVVIGIKADSWASTGSRAKLSVLALDLAGKPIKGQAVEVRGRSSQVVSTRKRMVGGFYAYDNRNEVKDLGSLCSGTTDAQGLLTCEAALSTAGQVELIATAKDAGGHAVQAAASVWVTRQGELWFAQDNDDRMDVLPEKKHYEPGDTARLQVRMPFREASALVAVEREGILDTRVITLRGSDPTIEVKIEPSWGPNVYVSVLALRGRIREVPWYSFFTWGWRAPLDWIRAFRFEGRDYQAPTALVDLSKPAFKLGVAALKIGIGAHELQVTVSADKPQYTVRQKAIVKLRVAFQGKPLAGARVAFAAVDEGLLALHANPSWDLLGALIQPRAWGVETSTAQSEIIGRRHYGRKAAAAGGGGGHSGTRELFDTLLSWQPEVTLDAKGEAVLEVPINDSLTSFRLVAVADAGTQQFGTGSASIRVTQDLQMLSGLPPLVREGDRFSAMLTLRNTTARAMTVHAMLSGAARVPGGAAPEFNTVPLALPAQDVTVPAGGATQLSWPISVPPDAFSIAWEGSATEQGGQQASDRIRLTQLVSPAVPVRVLQATLQQLEGTLSLPVAAPADALPASGPKRGGILVAVQPSLSGALPGMRRYFETYPFICLEQKTSKSVGLKDRKLWETVANALPTYLDSDGLASYFPPRAEDGPRGSDRLTAYVLAATQEAGFALPDDARGQMLDGLTAFVEGRIERKFWSPRADLDVRKLAAIEALSRYGRAQAKMLGSVNLTPNTWPTAAVIDWLRILKQVPGIENAPRRLDEANQILRSRLTYAGTTLKFSNEQDDFWWWLMDSADANAARLILAVLDDPAWKDDIPRMVVGALGRQRAGAWLTTTANLWGSLALEKFSAKFESVPIAGRTAATLGEQSGSLAWAAKPAGGSIALAWPASPSPLNVAQDGTGKPWLTVQTTAAVPLKAPLFAGYAVARSVIPVERKDPARWSRGDVVRIHLEVDAQTDMTWVVVSDPVPGGATILGSGLGRDSALATRGERPAGRAWAAFEERGFEAFRSYYEYMPRGKTVVEYTVRLNNPGQFSLPPTRVEAMYAPESFGELPNRPVEVAP